MSLEKNEIAYLLGRNGSTKQRLANFSGARLEIDPGNDGGRIEVIGTQQERELARLCVDITLQQRNNGKVQVDVDKLQARPDLCFLDVPKDAVGFILVRRELFSFGHLRTKPSGCPNSLRSMTSWIAMSLTFCPLQYPKQTLFNKQRSFCCRLTLLAQGAKGATLRGFEAKYRTFMFFDTGGLWYNTRQFVRPYDKCQLHNIEP
jgi:hypothetical protein